MFVYVIAALLAVVAAEALRWDREAAAAQLPRHPRKELRRARAAGGSDGFVTPLSAFASSAPAQPTAASAQAPAPQDADEQEEATAGIAPEDWKTPPPTNPDPSARPAIDDLWPRNGPESGGEKVQIRGRNLQPVYVLFGRSPAQILGVDDSGGTTTLTVVVPKRTGPAQEWVVVANRDGSNATAHFEYYR